MAIDFQWDMDRYLAVRRRKKTFSGIKSKVMNKKAVFSSKAVNKLGDFKGRLTSKIIGIRGKKKEPEKEITQEDINELVEKHGIKRGEEQGTRITPISKDSKEEVPEKKEEIGEGEGWEEVKLEKLQGEKEGAGSLEKEKRELHESLAEIGRKKELEKQKIAKFSEENQQREKEESKEERRKRLDLEEEVKILKEKQRIEEDRLAQLRAARRREQMQALRGRVTDILFKKRPKKEKDMGEEVRKDMRMEAKIREAERQRAEIKEAIQPKEDSVKSEEEKEEYIEIPVEKAKPEEKSAESAVQPKTETTQEEQRPEQKKEEPKKSFLSKFIQIKTSAQIAKEEEERAKREEEQALEDKSEIDKMFQEEVNEDAPAEEGVNLSTLFPDKQEEQREERQEGTIDLGKDYKIKVVKN